MNNTKRKELGLWYNPTEEASKAILEKARLQRLFNPKHERTEPSEKTIEYRKLRNVIREGKHGGCAYDLLKVLADLEIPIKKVELPRKCRLVRKQRVCPRILGRKPHINRLPTIISLVEANKCVMVNLGWKPNVSHKSHHASRGNPPNNYSYFYDSVEHKFRRVKQAS
jgi:hypothetical protein